MRSLAARFFAPDAATGGGVLWPRWIFLRCLGLIFFSAFFSLAFQIQGLIGPRGILPAGEYLDDVARMLPGLSRFYYVPSVLWIGAGSGALTALVWGGLIASVLLTLNIWPRGSIAVCLVLFLSFIGAAQDFSSYQSDGMLLEAAFLSLFFAPRGLRPGLGADSPPSRASLFLLRWEWFRIYFESGLVKLMSGDEQWRSLTAMDHYYETGPLPTWIGWYAHQLVLWATIFAFLPLRSGPLAWPATALAPFRIANAYGLFAVMTRGRWEIEFQGTRDGRTWEPYPFRYKPQDPAEAPGIYAPYQPRFEWNLWFASLSPWQQNPWVVRTEMRLLEGSPDVLALFRNDPFAGAPPRQVRTVLWQYWFTDRAERRASGPWWRRQFLGVWSPTVERLPDGRIVTVEDTP